MADSSPRVSMSHSPTYYQSRSPLTHAAHHSLRQPPAALLGHQVREYTPSPMRTYQPVSRPSVLVSSKASMSSSRSSRPRAYSPTLSPASQVRRSSVDRMNGSGGANECFPAGCETNQWQGTTQTRGDSPQHGHTVFTYTADESAHEPKAHAVWLLLWLSFLDPLYSLCGALCTVFSMLPLFMFSLFNACSGNYAFADAIVRFNAPILRLHLRLLHGDSGDPRRAGVLEYNAFKLALVNLTSPFLSIGVAMAAWVSASFWVFALIMGNPDGTERRDDGKAAVLAVRDWWEKYLFEAVR